MTKKLLDEATHAQERLKSEPANVAEFVDWTTFLRETQGRAGEFSSRGSAVNAMHDLMTEYDVPVPDADAASAAMMDSMLSTLSALVSQQESTLEERTTDFAEDIKTAISELRTKTTELRAETEKPILCDGETGMVRDQPRASSRPRASRGGRPPVPGWDHPSLDPSARAAKGRESSAIGGGPVPGCRTT